MTHVTPDNAQALLDSDQRSLNQHTFDPHAPYTLYKLDISYFSGKVEAYLKYKNIPHRAIEVDYFSINQVARATGIKKVPALKTRDDLWLFDSTPLMQWFEHMYTDAPILPDDGALRFLCLLIEDYADEWLWKPAMWWRWMPTPSRFALGLKMGGEIFAPWLARPMGWFFRQRQLREWLWDDGVTRKNHHAVRDLFYQELDFLEAVFKQQPYLLGSHPSAADFGYFASMFRHFGNDPSSSEIIRRQAPNTYEWLARLWNTNAEKLAPKPTWLWPNEAVVEPLLDRIANDYLPYLQQNAMAFSQNQTRFDHIGKHFTFKRSKTTHYRVYCREMLQREFQQLNEADKDRIERLFKPVGGLSCLMKCGIIPSHLEAQFKLPKNPKTDPPKTPSLWVRLMGQPRN